MCMGDASCDIQFTDHLHLLAAAAAATESCTGTLGVQEQEQPEQHQPQGSLQGLHLRHGGHRGARVMAGAGNPQPAMGEYTYLLYQRTPALHLSQSHGGSSETRLTNDPLI